MGMSTSCLLVWSMTVAWPLAPIWTIWSSGFQVVMRLSIPCRVGPAFWPGFTSSCSPTEIGHELSVPSISSRYGFAPLGTGQLALFWYGRDRAPLFDELLSV
jgi:hypothetical protein